MRITKLNVEIATHDKAVLVQNNNLTSVDQIEIRARRERKVIVKHGRRPRTGYEYLRRVSVVTLAVRIDHSAVHTYDLPGHIVGTGGKSQHALILESAAAEFQICVLGRDLPASESSLCGWWIR